MFPVESQVGYRNDECSNLQNWMTANMYASTPIRGKVMVGDIHYLYVWVNTMNTLLDLNEIAFVVALSIPMFCDTCFIVQRGSDTILGACSWTVYYLFRYDCF